jgi:hypothetical protein
LPKPAATLAEGAILRGAHGGAAGAAPPGPPPPAKPN